MNLTHTFNQMFCAVLLAFSLTQCTGVGPSFADGNQQTWRRYLHASPFSYSTSDSIAVVRNLNAELTALPAYGADARIAAHINAVRQWTASYPSYRIRAGAAYDEAYQQGKAWARPSGWAGKTIGRGMSQDDGLSQAFGGALGELIGRLGNEMYSRGSGEAAAAEIMRPLIQEARRLSAAEFEIDRMLGVAPTNHLRRILGRLGSMIP
ncbi:hypothetical protein [Prosthecobacter sp.]|uniref:hypothetical protein n=1 Tax=Prosthecobacter sp. TaxID=1965333 RepID=UPI003785298F